MCPHTTSVVKAGEGAKKGRSKIHRIKAGIVCHCCFLLEYTHVITGQVDQ